LLFWIKEVLDDRIVETETLLAHVDENAVQGVLNASIPYVRHLQGINIILRRFWEEAVKKRCNRLRRRSNTI